MELHTKKPPGAAQKAMLKLELCLCWLSLALAVALWLVTCPGAAAEESALGKDAEQYLADGNPKAALITLKSAVRRSPLDPAIHAQLARVYLRLDDAASAEREARAMRDLKCDEAEYLSVLIDALLLQKKFKDIFDLIEPGDRDPVLESKVRTALGTAAVRLGYDGRAEALLRDAIKLDPGAVAPRIQLAWFLNGTRPKEAEGVIDEAIAANPQSAELLLNKGDILWSRGDANDAVLLFDEALKMDPNYQLASLRRANVNIARGELTAADDDLDPILKASPKNFMANYLRGLEQVKQQQYVAADRTLDRISSDFPSFPVGYYLQGATKLALGQFEAAEVLLGYYLNRFPGDPNVRRLIARAALQQHGAPRAIDYLKPLVDSSPADGAILTLLGNAYMADDKPELALRQFEKAATLDPKNTTIKTHVAVAEINSGQGSQGLAQLEQLFADEAGATVAGPTLVLAELRAGHLDKAFEAATALIRQDSENALYLTLLGEVRVAQTDFAGAEAAFLAALARNPEFTAASGELAQLYAKTGRNDDAKKVYAALLSKNVTNTTALLRLADIAIAEHKSSEAVDLLNRARAANKFDPTAGLKLVGLYQRRHDWDSAKTVAAELYALFPRDVSIVLAFGRAQQEAGDINAAISAYKLAHQLLPDSIAIQSSYVSLLKQAKYFREARNILQEAVDRDPQNASQKGDLIRVDAEIGGVDEAVARAREFTAADPGNSLYELVSAELYEKAGRAGEAVALLENTIAARPADDGLAPALSRLYVRIGMPAKAEALLKARLTADPTDAVARSELAFFTWAKKTILPLSPNILGW